MFHCGLIVKFIVFVVRVSFVRGVGQVENFYIWKQKKIWIPHSINTNHLKRSMHNPEKKLALSTKKEFISLVQKLFRFSFWPENFRIRISVSWRISCREVMKRIKLTKFEHKIESMIKEAFCLISSILIILIWIDKC